MTSPRPSSPTTSTFRPSSTHHTLPTPSHDQPSPTPTPTPTTTTPTTTTTITTTAPTPKPPQVHVPPPLEAVTPGTPTSESPSLAIVPNLHALSSPSLKTPTETVADDSSDSSDDSDAEAVASMLAKLRKKREQKRRAQEEEEEGEVEDMNMYCICRTRDDGSFMIGCDGCDDWFHGDCVQVRKGDDAAAADAYFCPDCEDEPFPRAGVVAANRRYRKVYGAQLPAELIRRSIEAHGPQVLAAQNSRRSPASAPRRYKATAPTRRKVAPVMVTGERLATVRDKIRETFASVLPAELAKAIEEELFQLEGGKVAKAYKTQYRVILSNLRLKGNEQLRHRIKSGELSPRTLVGLNSEQLAPASVAKQRERLRQQDLEMRDKSGLTEPQQASAEDDSVLVKPNEAPPPPRPSSDSPTEGDRDDAQDGGEAISGVRISRDMEDGVKTLASSSFQSVLERAQKVTSPASDAEDEEDDDDDDDDDDGGERDDRAHAKRGNKRNRAGSPRADSDAGGDKDKRKKKKKRKKRKLTASELAALTQFTPPLDEIDPDTPPSSPTAQPMQVDEQEKQVPQRPKQLSIRPPDADSTHLAKRKRPMVAESPVEPGYSPAAGKHAATTSPAFTYPSPAPQQAPAAKRARESPTSSPADAKYAKEVWAGALVRESEGGRAPPPLYLSVVQRGGAKVNVLPIVRDMTIVGQLAPAKVAKYVRDVVQSSRKSHAILVQLKYTKVGNMGDDVEVSWPKQNYALNKLVTYYTKIRRVAVVERFSGAFKLYVIPREYAATERLDDAFVREFFDADTPEGKIWGIAILRGSVWEKARSSREFSRKDMIAKRREAAASKPKSSKTSRAAKAAAASARAAPAPPPPPPRPVAPQPPIAAPLNMQQLQQLLQHVGQQFGQPPPQQQFGSGPPQQQQYGQAPPPRQQYGQLQAPPPPPMQFGQAPPPPPPQQYGQQQYGQQQYGQQPPQQHHQQQQFNPYGQYAAPSAPPPPSLPQAPPQPQPHLGYGQPPPVQRGGLPPQPPPPPAASSSDDLPPLVPMPRPSDPRRRRPT